jgi:hypothetical protein
MTYREAIQIQIDALQSIYDNCEGLRDIAFTMKEKEAFNTLRRTLPTLWDVLQKVDNNLQPSEAAYQCKGNYSIKQ